MGKINGFLEFERKTESNYTVKERTQHYNEFTLPLSKSEVETQGARCMNCGIPFCHSGCPLGNLIPDFNDYVYNGRWKKALEVLHSTNNFPEFTGRLCPAPCEEACVLGINAPSVAIENIEKSLVENGFKEGWIQPELPKERTEKKVAIIGSGPSGLAAAQQLNRAGHWVTVFERDEKTGGLLRYGIPDFKLEKKIIDRRISILKKEGIIFKTNTEVGKNYEIDKLDEFDAIILAGGATERRPLPVKGIEINGVHQAMAFLKQQNKRNHHNQDYSYELEEKDRVEISAKNKNVIVIGGGDTGSDCIGTSNRHGAKTITNFELLSKPTLHRPQDQPWPFFPRRLKTTTSHEEGTDREWNINTKEFVADEKGNLKALKTVRVEWQKDENGRFSFQEIKGSEQEWPCELALLALGFTGPENTLAQQLNLETDARNNYITNDAYQTNKKHIFVAGDMRRGQSLIVWAISEGRECAHHVDRFLTGNSNLPTKGNEDLPSI